MIYTENTVVVASVAEIQAAFTEWDRRFREDPEAFMSLATHLLQGDEETYGEEATPYFLSILEGVKRGD